MLTQHSETADTAAAAPGMRPDCRETGSSVAASECGFAAIAAARQKAASATDADGF